METFFLELLILKKEGHLHFPLSAIVVEILISQKLQFDPYVDLCSILAVAAMFFGFNYQFSFSSSGSKIPVSYCYHLASVGVVVVVKFF
jgi:hypothetical protein